MNLALALLLRVRSHVHRVDRWAPSLPLDTSAVARRMTLDIDEGYGSHLAILCTITTTIFARGVINDRATGESSITESIWCVHIHHIIFLGGVQVGECFNCSCSFCFIFLLIDEGIYVIR